MSEKVHFPQKASLFTFFLYCSARENVDKCSMDDLVWGT